MFITANFSINDKLIPKIREEAQKDDISKSKVVNNILENYFNKKETIENERDSKN